MIQSACTHELTKKFGKNRNGTPRVRCCLCGKTWTVSPPNLIGNMRLEMYRAEMILECLCEGTSARVAARLAKVDRQTVLDLMVFVGERCARFMQAELRNLAVEEVQLDEAWQFIFCKQKTAVAKRLGPEVGDSYTYVAFERHTKLILAWHFGKRDQWNTDIFCAKLSQATGGRFSISTDGFDPYRSAIIRYLGERVEHGVLVKIFGKVPQDEARKYSPAKIAGIKKEQAWNLPDPARICTSHVERQNLNFRTFMRRMTRLSNGFSKKWQNHEAMLALYIMHYNYCRPHGTLKTTPAVASGLTSHRWTIRELLEKTATH